MSQRIPDGWTYWANGGPSSETAWFYARGMKEAREEVRPDLFVRVRVVMGPGGFWWILRREEKKETRS